MQKVVLPKNFEFIAGDTPHAGQVVIGPCYPGYGTTLGNGIRRVLLSSLPGAAVLGVKIANANHEFSALDNVKEDVLQVILNLKQLRLKIHNKEAGEVVTLKISHKGGGTVTAAEIEASPDVEVVNKDLVIAEITDDKGSFEADIFASNGYGYVSIENRASQEEKEVGYIEMDSIFTPITAVQLNIENVRVGQMTDWEKMVLSITTDGTITYEDAFKSAVEILVEQFGFMLEQAGGEVKAAIEEVQAIAKETEETPEVTDDAEEAKEEAKDEATDEKKKK
jgi:DNA-directed RNA polymerase subunit alpha